MARGHRQAHVLAGSFRSAGCLSSPRPAAGALSTAGSRADHPPTACVMSRSSPPRMHDSRQFLRSGTKTLLNSGSIALTYLGGCVNRLIVLAAAAGAAMSLLSAGKAGAQGAPDVTGKKYSEATAALKNAGFTAQLAAKVGDQLSQGDCLVSSQAVLASTSSFGPSQFKGGGGNNIVMLSLNCNGGLASAGESGNSAASPEGQAAKKLQEKVEWESSPDGQAWCKEAKIQYPRWDWSVPNLAGCGGAS
jgi:PASTA domain